MKHFKRITAIIIATLILATTLALPSFSEESENAVIAHWKFQNQEGYYTGNADDDTLRFIDLSGNGNDLEVGVEGNGAQLDIFSWDNGVDYIEEGCYYESASSLKFDNTWEKALSVDPYDAELTTYSGAYVSGKYLQTVENAPMNALDGEDGWTIEVIFKISEEWNVHYNRYTGIFSKQGVLEDQDEPPLLDGYHRACFG